MNHRIRSREIRVIDPDGQQLGIMPPELALQKAVEHGLDLVEISPDSRPPVCRIMDYGKYKYAQKKKFAEARKNQAVVTVKEVKYRPKIEMHDYNTKTEMIRRFLSEGHKVKVTMMFRGREITHHEFARRILDRVIEDLKTEAVVEQHAKLDGRNMVMMLAPVAKH